MRSTYYLTVEHEQWSVFVHDREVLRIQSSLRDEPTAVKRALQHAKATGRHFDMRIYRVEPDGGMTSVFESHKIM
jgi:hypothetical protein